MGLLHNLVIWYGINYAGTQITQWDLQNKGTRTSPTRLSFVLKVPLCNLRPSIIFSVLCDRIGQRAYWFMLNLRISNYGCTREVWRARKTRYSSSRQ